MINEIQKDNASLYLVWRNFNKIINFYKSTKLKFPDISKDIINNINDKWNKHINLHLIEATRLFNLEINFKYDKGTINFIKDWGTSYLIQYNIVENKDIDFTKNNLDLQFNEFISRDNDFSFINSKSDELEDFCKLQNKKYNKKIIWGKYLHSHYELSKIAIAILSICPSEASVERSFSIQSNAHSLDRNRLSELMIDAEMNIIMNYEN